MLVDLHGNAVWQADYDPWGNRINEKNPSNLYQPIRMQGLHYDEESGLHYNRYRYYDPKSVRYITQDPIGLLGGMNGYNYPLNPTLLVDPLGLIKMYGNWCGPNWTGGYKKPWDQLTPEEQATVMPPVDNTDACCETHDKCHAQARTDFPCDANQQENRLQECDRQLADCIDKNTSGSERWGRPYVIKTYMYYSNPDAELSSQCK